ncbi:hypothetical protein PENTCL1PPCAC_3942, partial [Pristionchus entomophagus]
FQMATFFLNVAEHHYNPRAPSMTLENLSNYEKMIIQRDLLMFSSNIINCATIKAGLSERIVLTG